MIEAPATDSGTSAFTRPGTVAAAVTTTSRERPSRVATSASVSPGATMQRAPLIGHRAPGGEQARVVLRRERDDERGQLEPGGEGPQGLAAEHGRDPVGDRERRAGGGAGAGPIERLVRLVRMRQRGDGGRVADGVLPACGDAVQGVVRDHDVPAAADEGEHGSRREQAPLSGDRGGEVRKGVPRPLREGGEGVARLRSRSRRRRR